MKNGLSTAVQTLSVISLILAIGIEVKMLSVMNEGRKPEMNGDSNADEVKKEPTFRERYAKVKRIFKAVIDE